MILRKQQKEIVLKIAAGEIFDIPSFLLTMHKDSFKIYNTSRESEITDLDHIDSAKIREVPESVKVDRLGKNCWFFHANQEKLETLLLEFLDLWVRLERNSLILTVNSKDFIPIERFFCFTMEVPFLCDECVDICVNEKLVSYVSGDRNEIGKPRFCNSRIVPLLDLTEEFILEENSFTTREERIVLQAQADTKEALKDGKKNFWVAIITAAVSLLAGVLLDGFDVSFGQNDKTVEISTETELIESKIQVDVGVEPLTPGTTVGIMEAAEPEIGDE